ncbi:MAG TPA: hypothetical protein VH538_02740 [Gaiellaceae bacterium]
MRREFEGRSGGHDECVVRFWQGYVTGEFQAYLPGSAVPFLSSAPFRTWRPPWQARVTLDESPAAAAAFAALTDELVHDGWRPFGADGAFAPRVFVRDADEVGDVNGYDPASMPEELFLRALDSVAGEEGATAAQVGRALYGDEAASVRRLPQRVGSRLRALQLQGKVDRYEAGGVKRWFPRPPDDDDAPA